jgi:hypothetical protein
MAAPYRLRIYGFARVPPTHYRTCYREKRQNPYPPDTMKPMAPIRFSNTGMLAIILFVLAFFHIQQRFLNSPIPAEPWEISEEIRNSDPVPPSDPSANPGNADLDSDGILDAWENQFAHNPHDRADRDADFDRDGLTALQEYHLHQTTGGAYGNPLGNWRLQTITAATDDRPPGYSAISSLTLIESSSNGLLLVLVRGVLDDASTISTFPHVFDPASAT